MRKLQFIKINVNSHEDKTESVNISSINNDTDKNGNNNNFITFKIDKNINNFSLIISNKDNDNYSNEKKLILILLI